jgi:hypothetical protein
MYKLLFVVTLFGVILFGCNDHPEQEVAIIGLVQKSDSLQLIIDSLQTEIDRQTQVVDSVTIKYREQRTLILFTRSKCLRYSKIVGKDHSQAVFIVNWIHRAFEWVDE